MLKVTPRIVQYLNRIVCRTASGRINHKNVEGAISLASSEMQDVFCEHYVEYKDLFFTCVDNTYVQPVGDYKGVTKAYTINDATYELLERCVSEAPHMLKKKISPTNILKAFTEHVKLDVIKNLLARDDFFHNKEDQLILRIYLNNCNDDGTNVVTYSRRDTVGRRFATGPSLQSIPKYIRWLITSDVSDIDQVNCHMVLLQSFARSADEDVEMDTLDEYIANREAFLTRICVAYGVERSAAKKLILMASYGASFNLNVGWGGAVEEWILENKAIVSIKNEEYQHPAFIKTLTSELKAAGVLMLGLPQFAQFAAMEYKSRALALALQSAEDYVLGLMEAYFKSIGKVVSTLMFDGCHVDGLVTENELKDLEKNVRKALMDKYSIECSMKFSNTYHA
jgi:hypothetical protein